MNSKTLHHKNKVQLYPSVISVLFFSLLLLFLAACTSSQQQEPQYYAESQPSFFDLRNGSWVDNQWIRKPENMLMVHETFKTFGYEKLLSNIFGEYNQDFLIQGIYIKKKVSDLIDSLEMSYLQPGIDTLYYHKFWQRRKAENNDSAAFIIIRDINSVLKQMAGATTQPIKNSKNIHPNDTLLALLNIEFSPDTLTREKVIENFNTLKQYGFHQSAAIYLDEHYNVSFIVKQKEQLIDSLTKADFFTGSWIQDNSK